MNPGILQGMFEVAEFHAKEPGKKFKPDSAGKRADADSALCAVAEHYVGPIYRELECARREGFGLETESMQETRPLPKCFRLPLSFDVTEMQRELRGLLGSPFIAHFNSAYYEGDWSALPLRSLGGRQDQIYPDPTHSEAYANTAHLAQCPYMQSVLDYFQCPLLSVRLLRLSAGSVIREHRDLNLGFEDGEVRLHIPVVTNPGVEFYLDRERVIMLEGECWYNNLSLPHSVVNRGVEDRIHLVLDMQVNDWLKELLCTAAVSTADSNQNIQLCR
jgi:hypothetical protein